MLNEVRAAPGDVCTIIECRPRGLVSPLLAPIGIHRMLENQHIRIGGGMQSPHARVRAEVGSDGSFRKHRLIDEFLATEFLKNVDESRRWEYKLSVAIAEFLFEFYTGEDTVDGITYPSIAADQGGANVAMLPVSFNRIYEPVHCKRLTIAKKLDDHGFAFFGNIEAKSIGERGAINW